MIIQHRRLSEVGSDWPRAMAPLLDRIYRGRGLRFASELDLRMQRWPHPGSLPDIDRASELLSDAVIDGAPLLVLGDYDADGASGAALCVRALRAFGHPKVDVRVPDRQRHGYGLSEAFVDELDPSAELLLTVDHGSSSVKGALLAKRRGFKVIVTDHHLLSEELPQVEALVNPLLMSGASPLKHLSGAGVAFYTMLATRQRLRVRGWFAHRPEPNLAELLDLVALGTIADLVPLDTLNRSMVAAGLKRVRALNAHVGVQALLTIAGRDPKRCQARDFAFTVAPRINAAGRLDDMSIGVRCLLSDDPVEAMKLAGTLDTLNQERRELQDEMQAQAFTAVEEAMRSHHGGTPPDVLVVGQSHWHPGVVGLVASKLCERHHRPAFAFAPASAGSDEWRGSARSIEGVHVRDALADVDALHPGLIMRFGGHAMAAGLSVSLKHYPALAQALNDVISRKLNDQLRARVIETDGALNADEYTLDAVALMEQAGPFGQGFAEPLFDDWFVVKGRSLLKERHLKMRLQAPHGQMVEAMFFNFDEEVPSVGSRLRMLFQLSRSDYQGLSTVLLLVRKFV